MDIFVDTYRFAFCKHTHRIQTFYRWLLFSLTQILEILITHYRSEQWCSTSVGNTPCGSISTAGRTKKNFSLKKAVIFWMVHQVTTLQFTLLCTKFFVKTEAQRWSKTTNIYSLRWTSFQYNFFDSLSKFEAKRKKKSKETKIEVSSLCAHTQIHTLARTHARAQENSPTSKSLSHTRTYAHTHTHVHSHSHTFEMLLLLPSSTLKNSSRKHLQLNATKATPNSTFSKLLIIRKLSTVKSLVFSLAYCNHISTLQFTKD